MLTNKKINLVISIVAAIAIWVYVMIVINPDSTATIKGVPVELQGLETLAADGFTVGNVSYAVDVTVSGSRSDLNALSPDDFQATANLKGYSLGTNIPVDVRVTAPPRVEIKGQRPERIEVNIEELVSVAKPIMLSYSKKFPKDTEPGFVTLSPHEIDVSGTKNAVGGVAYVTAEIDSDDLRETETKIVAPASPSKNNGDRVFDVELSQNTIEVTATLCHVKKVPLMIDVTGELDPGLTITKQDIPPTVSIRGSDDALANITELMADPIDISKLEETAIIEPHIQFPKGVELADASRDLTVTIEIGGVEARDFTFTADQIEIINTDAGYTAHVNTGTIIVTIFGTADQIKDFTAEDLAVFVDLKEIDYSAEFADVGVQIKHKKKLARVESSPDKVRVIITKIPDSTTIEPTAPAIEPGDDGGTAPDDDTGTGAGIDADTDTETGTGTAIEV
jgi:YbbR domain-containing protein